MKQRKKSDSARVEMNFAEENELNVEERISYYSLFNPRGKHHRYIALSFMCWLGFASNYWYENPSALQDRLMLDLNITSTQFSVLYSIYAWPSIIACVVGGVLVDSVFGIRMGTIIYMAITLIGQLTYATGGLIDAFWVMVLGRFIFGIGSEPLSVAQEKYTISWFKGKELNMVFGLHSSCNNLGSVIAFWTTDPLYTWTSKFYSGYKLLGVVLLIGNITCIYSMLCSIILGVIDKRATSTYKKIEKDVHMITLKDIKNFHWNFWPLVVIRSINYVTIYSFIALSKVFFMSKFSMTSDGANRVNSLMFIVCIIGAPLLGIVIDRVGRNISWLIGGIICTITAHGILAFTSWHPSIAVILLSISASILSSAFWPIVALTIPCHQLGTAYGLCWSIANLLLGIITIIAGSIVDHVGYFWLEVFFLLVSGVSLIATVILLMADTAQRGVLNMTTSEREAYQVKTGVSEAPYEEITGNNFANSPPIDILFHPPPEMDMHSR